MKSITDLGLTIRVQTDNYNNVFQKNECNVEIGDYNVYLHGGDGAKTVFQSWDINSAKDFGFSTLQSLYDWLVLSLNTGSGGGGGGTPIIPYNKEAELVIENTNHTIGANTVHSYSIFVEQGTGTISINGGTAINIGLGYQKNVEFTATNDYSVVITSNINSKVRIVKIY